MMVGLFRLVDKPRGEGYPAGREGRQILPAVFFLFRIIPQDYKMTFWQDFCLRGTNNRGGSMKINEELERLLNAELNRPQRARQEGNSAAEGFESVLARQLSQTGGAAPQALPMPADPPLLADISVAALGGLEEEDGGNSDEALVESLTGGIRSGLDGLAEYAARLRDTSESALRDAWASLSPVDDSLAGMRRNLEKLSRPDAELESLLNEVEILTTAERFKFNRGDYLPE
jgi:hypothetical protein